MAAQRGDVTRRLRRRPASVVRKAKKLADRLLGGLGVAQSDEAIERAAQSLWNASPDTLRKSDAHWRGAGSFSDDDLWLNIGRRNLELYQSFARAIEFDRELHTIVDWGCGGGANAVHFGPLAEAYFGVDVSAASLDECRRQATAAGTLDFRPVLIEIGRPEAALDLIDRSCDLFLCTYVFELVPTQRVRPSHPSHRGAPPCAWRDGVRADQVRHRIVADRALQAFISAEFRSDDHLPHRSVLACRRVVRVDSTAGVACTRRRSRPAIRVLPARQAARQGCAARGLTNESHWRASDQA